MVIHCFEIQPFSVTNVQISTKAKTNSEVKNINSALFLASDDQDTTSQHQSAVKLITTAIVGKLSED